MGFSGGSSNVTKAHTHSSSIVQDGGALNFSNVTQSGMSAGDITYSNGTALQTLAYPGSPSGETLTAVAASTQPSWAAAGGPTGNMIFVERFTLTPASDTFTCTLATPIAASDFVSIKGILRGQWNSSGTGALELQIATDNSTPITHTGYSWASNVLTSSANFHMGEDIDNFTVGASTSSDASAGNIYFELMLNPFNDTTLYCQWWQIGRGSQQAWGGGFCYDSDDVDSINGFYFTNSGGNNIAANTTFDVYKLTS
jgi:hypothetical protein